LSILFSNIFTRKFCIYLRFILKLDSPAVSY